MTNCSVSHCNTVFGIGGDVNINLNGVDVDNCGSVFNFSDQNLNISIDVKKMNVKNTDTYITVSGGEQPITQSTFKSTSPQYRLPSLSSNDECNAIMRIAFQYLNSLNK